MPIAGHETALESISRVKQAVEDVRARTKCLCGKCKTCANRRYSAEWRKRHPGPKRLTRVRNPGIGTGKTAESKTSWRNKQLNSMEKAIAASRKANHQPERFADWSKRRIEELRCKWREIGVN